PDLHVANRVIVTGGVRHLFGIEARSGVPDYDSDLVAIDPISDGNDPIDLALVSPLNGIGPQLAHRHRELLGLYLVESALKKKAREQLVELVEITEVALQMEMNLAKGPVLQQGVAPGVGFVHRVVELLGRERLR